MNNAAPLFARHRVPKLLLGFLAGVTLTLLVGCGGDAQPPASELRSEVSDVPTSSDAVGSADADRTSDVAAAIGGSGVATDDTADTASTTGDTTSTESTPAAEQYLSEASELVSAVTAASERVASQLDQADVDSATWRSETAALLRELAAVLDSTADLTAPPEYTTQHRELLDATGKYSWATELLASGVETLDLNTISDAAALLANASAEFAVAQAALAS